ncbi:discoidin domain-containing receptor 2-like [Zootermopsis nevadensis]|uniref:discoidin domain-containing receptor 2-like n=1 Tax=Zootermopsis nevadensis TaxID=136037 RepID=UPI000B8E9CC9|nr:discoidin domain-containing receptor 2-like [Zootermopsis nevadensis]
MYFVIIFNIPGECRSALGMEEGRIPDTAITASSSYEAKSVGPQNARLRQEKNGGAWCPKAQISSEVREFLEVDLMRPHLIMCTETQGRFGNGQGQEYAEQFLVEYWRDTLQQWTVYKDSRGHKVLSGNTNTYLVVRQELELPFVASRVRFIPYSLHTRTVCMRVELYGCPWEQSIVSYSAPRGDVDSALEDLSYDGILDGRQMHGGLGQLVDGLFGDDHLQDDTPDSRWVGWLNDTFGGQPVQITFEFDGPREFSAAHLHTSNLLSMDTQVFTEARVFFSLDGERYQQTPLYFSLDTKGEDDWFRDPPPHKDVGGNSRNVTIPLQNRVGRFVRVELEFSTKWILLSEVYFDSAPSLSNVTDEQYFLQQDGVQDTSGNPTNAGGETTHARKEITPATSATNNHQAYIGLITGVLAMVVLLLACTVVLMVRRGRKKVALLHKHTALVSSSTKPGVTINMKDLKMNMALSTPIINNGLSRSRVAAAKSKNKVAGTTTPAATGKANNIYGHMVVGEESEDSENSSVYHEPYKLLPSTKQEYGCLLKKDTLSSSKSGEYTDFTSVNSFQEDVKFSSPSFYNLTPPPPPTSRPPPYEVQNFPTPTKTPPSNTPIENYYAATDIVKTERREQHFTPGKFTAIKIPEGSPRDGSSASFLEFPRHRLRLVEKLGEGGFGMVHLCEAEGIPEYNGVSSFHKKQLVVVKSLWRGSGETTRQEFLREVSWLASFRDPNLTRIIGICSQEEPLCVIQEHSDLGDLPQFLQLQSLVTDDGTSTLSYGCLIFLATQIASGMKYLESLEMVHRDVAARNCVVGKNYVVKISDHAMYCGQYEADYYVSDTKSRLPIRWMAWESLLLGKQSTKSDVWSFAVTLWEILMLCGQQPFAELTSEQVVENCNHWYQNDGLQRYLSRPPSCPREIYDLMGECWKRHEADRPRFGEIHLFLQRKNLGYVPANG